MHPEHERGILGAVARAGRKHPDAERQLAVNAAMDRPDATERALSLTFVGEGQREHRSHRAIEALRRRPRRRAKPAVVVDAGRDQRMCKLQKHGARPAEQHEALGVDPTRNGPEITRRTQADVPLLRHRRDVRNRSALPMTETDDRLIARLAMIGDSSKPKAGYSTPAASGTPSAL